MKRPTLQAKKSRTILPPIKSISSLDKSKLKQSNQDFKSAPCLKIFDNEVRQESQRRLTIKQIIQQHYSNYKHDMSSPLIIASAIPGLQKEQKEIGNSNEGIKNNIKLNMKNREKRLKRLFVRYQDQESQMSILRKSKIKESILKSARCETEETNQTDINLSRHCLYNFFRRKLMPIENKKQLEIQKNRIILKPKQVTTGKSIQSIEKTYKIKSEPKPLTAILDKPKKTIKEISLCGWFTKNDQDNIQ